MKIKKRGPIIILFSILTLCVLAVMGFRGFVNSIRNQRTCEWTNIDNIELHAHIDVPRVTKWDCNYEKRRNTKRASFTIDKNWIDINQYIEEYQFNKLDSAMEIDYSRFLHPSSDSLIGSDLYYKRSPSDSERYDVLLDKTTARLWVTIEYKDDEK